MRSAQLRGTKRINGAVSAFVIVTVIQYMTLVPGLFRPMGGSGEHKGPYPVRTGRRRKALNCNPEINIIWEERIMRTSKLLRSEEHTSELQSLMRISYAVFCLQKNNTITNERTVIHY